MTVYSYAELMGLWINAGGPRSLAPVAAAIALAESRGNSDAYNAHDSNGRGGTQVSAGLWQISNGTMTPVANWSDPAVNAKDAVAKWKAGSPKCGSGPNFCPWGTFTSGAYKGFLSGKTTPNLHVPKGGGGGVPASGGGAGGQGGGSITLDAVAKSLNPDCLWSVGWAGISGTANISKGFDIFGAIASAITGNVPGAAGGIAAAGNAGNVGAFKACIISKSQARAVVGAGLMLLGLPIGMAGLVVLGVAAGLKALGPVGAVAEGVGGAVTFIPGAQGAGAAISSAGRTARSGRRRASGQASEPDPEVVLGNPRENPDLEVRGGAVRETPADTAARKRRQQGAARAAARRSAGQGRPASREEAGF